VLGWFVYAHVFALISVDIEQQLCVTFFNVCAFYLRLSKLCCHLVNLWLLCQPHNVVVHTGAHVVCV